MLFMEIRNSLGAVDLESPASIWVVSSLVTPNNAYYEFLGIDL
jgi:hypothetical protein